MIFANIDICKYPKIGLMVVLETAIWQLLRSRRECLAWFLCASCWAFFAELDWLNVMRSDWLNQFNLIFLIPINCNSFGFSFSFFFIRSGLKYQAWSFPFRNLIFCVTGGILHRTVRCTIFSLVSRSTTTFFSALTFFHTSLTFNC